MNPRQQQIGEALHDLRTLLLDPDAFGDTNVADATVSLASEFVGEFKDDEILRRLGELVEAEQAGRLKVAGRHLRAVEAKLKTRWGITPIPSEPLIPDTVAHHLAAKAPSERAKSLVADPHSRPASPQKPRTGYRAPSGRSGTVAA